MPAVSKAQQALMAMALHSPEKVSKKNKGVLKMSKDSLKDYVKTPAKKLPKKKAKNSLRAFYEGE